MAGKKNLLVELFVEELPPKALKKLGESFANTILEQLKSQGLAGIESKVTPYASPRRLGAHVTAVATQAADRPLSQKLMPVSVGLDAQGRPTPALVKKLQSLGADASAASQLKRGSTKARRKARHWPKACRRHCKKASRSCRSPRS